jgi:outer membrane protein TolC
LINVAHRLFAAKVDLYDQAEQKAQVLQRQLDVYTEAESNLEKWVKDGMATEADLERLRYDKFSLELDLLKAKGGQENHEPKAQPTAP